MGGTGRRRLTVGVIAALATITFGGISPLVAHAVIPQSRIDISGSQVYGGAPKFQWSFETPSDQLAFSGTATCTAVTTASITAALAVGTYTIDPNHCGGLMASMRFPLYIAATGDFTVSRAPLTATVSGTQQAGGTPQYSASLSGFVNGDSSSVVTGALSGCGTTATGSSPAGTGYHVIVATCTGLTAANYSIAYQDGGFTVSAASSPVITSTPLAGGGLTFTAGGFTPGETVTATVHSTPHVIGTYTAGSMGVVVVNVVFSGLAAGTHTLILTGATSNTTISTTFTVPATTSAVRALSTPETGVGGGPAGTGMALIAIGAIAIVCAGGLRRRAGRPGTS